MLHENQGINKFPHMYTGIEDKFSFHIFLLTQRFVPTTLAPKGRVKWRSHRHRRSEAEVELCLGKRFLEKRERERERERETIYFQKRSISMKISQKVENLLNLVVKS